MRLPEVPVFGLKPPNILIRLILDRLSGMAGRILNQSFFLPSVNYVHGKDARAGLLRNEVLGRGA